MFLPSNITLQFGDSGDFVTELQRRLCLVHCFSDTMVNGFYDGNTVGGVTRFQAMAGLHADGVAGPETLRRLNGVISGGEGTTAGSKPEEEKVPEHTASVLDDLLPSLPAAIDPALLALAAAPEPREQTPQQQQAVKQQAAQLAPPQAELPPMQPLPPLPEQAKPLEHPKPDSALADKLLSAVQPHHAPTPQPKEPPQRPPIVEAKPPIAEHQPAHSAVAAPTQQAGAEAAPQRQGLLGRTVERTVQFANAVMQKLSDYFEAKLPPQVLHEVREIGQTMFKSGLREAPIPTGPDMVRVPQTPARGPEQQQQATPPAGGHRV